MSLNWKTIKYNKMRDILTTIVEESEKRYKFNSSINDNKGYIYEYSTVKSYINPEWLKVEDQFKPVGDYTNTIYKQVSTPLPIPKSKKIPLYNLNEFKHKKLYNYLFLISILILSEGFCSSYCNLPDI
jgi:hypothetical protein